jgi:homogentisate 1,2-dioxygenase
LTGTMAFMFETRFPQRVTSYAAALSHLQAGYRNYGASLQKHFHPERP